MFIIEMELIETMLIGLAVVIISLLLMYVIIAFSTKEKSFEEVLAAQKKREEEENKKLKGDKKVDRDKKKYRRFKAEKPKEKNVQVSEVELSSDFESKADKMVEYELEPEIIEPVQIAPVEVTKPAKSSKAGGKSKKVKSILMNKEEKSPLISNDEAPELVHYRHPKDEFDLKLKHEQELSPVGAAGTEKGTVEVAAADSKQDDHPKKSVSKKSRVVEKKEVVHHHEEVSTEYVATQKTSVIMNSHIQHGHEQQAPVSVVNKERKHGKKVTDEQVPPQASLPNLTTGANLVSALKTTRLTDSEVQVLIDILLNRQSSSVTEWNKKSQKGDPVSQIRKQLEEKDKALHEEQQLVMSTNNRLKEMRNEVTHERNQYEITKKTSDDKINYQAAEILALQERMKHTHESHRVEVNGLKARLQQMENQLGNSSQSQNIMQKITEENKQLKDTLAKTQSDMIPPAEVNNLRQQVNIMQKELSSNIVKLNSAENTKKSVEAKLRQYEEKLRSVDMEQKDSGLVLSKKLEEVNQQLRKSESQNGNLINDLHKADTEMHSAQNECKLLKTKLQELQRSLSGVDEHSRGCESKLKAAEKEQLSQGLNMKKLEKQLDEAQRRESEIDRKFKVAEQEKASSEANLKHLEKQLEEGHRRESEKDSNYKELQAKIYNLKEELRVSQESHVQGGTGDNVSSVIQLQTHNGDINEQNRLGDNVIEIAEHKRLLCEKDSEISRIASDLTSRCELLSEKDKEISRLKVNISSQSSSLSGKDDDVSRLKSDISSQSEKINNLSAELENQKKKNNEIREKNWKAMEALEKAEKSAHEKVDNALKTARMAESEKLLLVKSIKDLEKRYSEHDREFQVVRSEKESLTKELQVSREYLQQQEQPQLQQQPTNEVSSSNENIIDLMIHKKMLDEKEQEIGRLTSDLTYISNEVDRLTSEVKDQKNRLNYLQSAEDNMKELDSQVHEYRNVLAETESKLKQLEDSVEGEEKRWYELLAAKQTELEELKKENSMLQSENTEAKGNTELQEKIERMEIDMKINEDNKTEIENKNVELEEKVERIEIDIRTTVEKKIEIENKYTEIHKKWEYLEVELKKSKEIRIEIIHKLEQSQDSLTVVQKELTEAKDNLADLEALKKLIEELRGQLASEKQKNKEMASQVVRLNGTLKIGQAAVAEEQRLVKSLQDQLDSISQQSSGSGSGDNGLKELKSKLTDTQKQLEREIMTNRQLSQRLGASGSDKGTTV